MTRSYPALRRALAGVGAGLTAVALLLTVSCTDSPSGPAGRVVGAEREFECHTERTGTGTKTETETRQVCGWEYELTTRDEDGREHEFEVPSYVYRDCRRGPAYPSCIDR